MRLAAAAAIAFGAACGGSPSAPSPTPTPTPTSTPAPSTIGVRYDTIPGPHEFLIGTPIPTQNQKQTYCCWPFPVRSPGVYEFDLAAFPLNVLPSGGNSNVVSESEMVIVGIDLYGATGAMTFQWHKAVTNDVIIYSSTGMASWSWMCTYIGHFSWEISEPGPYYVIVGAPGGAARIDFRVTNSGTVTAAANTTRATGYGAIRIAAAGHYRRPYRIR